MISNLLGGIGLFLLGMLLMTDGLRAAAGDALRRVLSRFVAGPLSALVSGAGMTLLVQSSSAVTLATIGFVSAGLVSFPQAIGVLLGANLGTTSTGWIVSVLGFKLDVATFAFPLVGLGALVRLLASGRRAALGTALCGFGLIFVGIDTLQAAMEGLAARIDVSAFAGAGPARVPLLVGAGAVMTVVLQSSSAAVATTLTALHAGAVSLPDGAALVVGQNVGTTVKAAFASVGASVPARRTAVAHILFNLATAAAALVLLRPLLRGALFAAGGEPAMALAAFHTAFNLLGVALFLPWLGMFAAFVERLVPERGPTLARYLDPSVASFAPVAIETARRALVEVAAVAVAAARLRLGARRDEAVAALAPARAALGEVRGFLAGLRSEPDSPGLHERHVATLHGLDHLERLVEALAEDVDATAVSELIQAPARDLVGALRLAEAWTQAGGDVHALAELSASVAEARRGHRAETLTRTAAGALDPGTALARIEAMRWLDRLAYHLWRALHHFAGGAGGESEAFAEPEDR